MTASKHSDYVRKTRTRAMHEAVAQVHRAQRELSAARRRLAKATFNDAPHVVVQPRYRAAHAAARALGEKLRGAPGIVGVALGRVMKAGMPTGEPCVTVLVTEKLGLDELRRSDRRRLPKSVKAGKGRLRVDVVAVGTYRPHVLAGTSLGPVVDANGSTSEGTIGAFATDLTSGDLVAITAMHVTGLTAFPNGGPPPRFVIPSPMQQQPTTALGVLLAGTRSGVDAAKISLDAPGDAASFIPGVGAVAGWRPATFPGDQNASVRMAGAVSGVTHGAIIHVDVSLPDIGMEGAILADIPSVPGDSGAPLLDAENHILGFLAGELTGATYANLRAFSPVALVLSLLQCDIKGESS